MKNKHYPPRTKREFYDLAKKNHLCTACLHYQLATWKGACPKCAAEDTREYMPSMAELKRASGLILLQRAGRITRLRFHPRFDLIVNNVKVCTYEADADYYDENNRYVVEDTKPNGDIPSPESALKIALFDALHVKVGVKVKIFSGT